MIVLDTPRASDLRAALESSGVTGAAQDALLRETAPKRAELRSYAAYDALLDAAIAAHDRECVSGGGHDACQCFHHDADARFGGRRNAANVRRVAAAIGFADVAGVGGRMGVAGDATVRVPALHGLGKGRKRARDGSAWSAAIEAASYRVNQPLRYQMYAQGEQTMGAFGATHDGQIVFGSFGVDSAVQYVDPDLAVASGSAVEVEHAIPHAWLLTIAREGLRRAAGLPGWHNTVPVWFDAQEGTAIAEWAAAVNALEALARVSCVVCETREVPRLAVFERPADALVSHVPTCRIHASADETCCALDRAGKPCDCDAHGPAHWGPRTKEVVR